MNYDVWRTDSGEPEISPAQERANVRVEDTADELWDCLQAFPGFNPWVAKELSGILQGYLEDNKKSLEKPAPIEPFHKFITIYGGENE